MYRKVVLAGCLLAAASGAFAQKSFVVKGNLAGDKSGLIRITYNNKLETIKDSVHFTNGKFEFRGVIESPCEATIVIDPINGRITKEQYYSQDLRNLYIEPGLTTIESKSGLKSAVIRGGQQQKDYEQCQAVEDTTAKRIWAIADLGQIYNAAGNTRGLDSLRKKRVEVLKFKTDFDSLFVINHPKSYVAFWKLYWFAKLDVMDFKRAEAVFNTYSDDIRQSYFGKELLERIRIAKTLQPGKPAPEIALPDTSGNMVTLSSLKGRYVLICFLQNPATRGLQSLFAQLSGRNFTIYAITFSDNYEQWKKALVINAAPWINVMDDNEHKDTFHGLVSKAARAYNRHPQNINQCFLIGPNGMIVLPATMIDQDFSKKIINALKN